MVDESADYSQIYDFLYRIDRRVGYLEKDAAFIEKKIDSLETNKSKEFDLLVSELKGLRSNMLLLKNNFGQCVHGMVLLSKDLKNVVKKDDLQGLNAQVDDLKFEEYVTRKDLDRGV
jgi:hypothetical protein